MKMADWLSGIRTRSCGSRSLRRRIARTYACASLESLEDRVLLSASPVHNETLSAAGLIAEPLQQDVVAGSVVGSQIGSIPLIPGPTRPLPLPPSSPHPLPTPDSSELVQNLRGLMSDLGIDVLDDLGTIELNAPNNSITLPVLQPGIYLLQPSGTQAPPAPAGWSIRSTGFTGSFTGSSTSAVAATVVRYEGSQVLDRAVILANEVVFDGAQIQLSDNIRELFIVAESIRSVNDSVITWAHQGTAADAMPNIVPGKAALGTPNYDPHDTAGGAGSDGGDAGFTMNGANGNNGLQAPDVYIFVRSFLRETNTTGSSDAFQVSLPKFDLRGQHGGQGQKGQDGGDGGDGAKGEKAHSTLFNCKSGAGFGGDGGDAGDGGNGGIGGLGGNGGSVFVYHVETPDDTVLQLTGFQTAGGLGGPGGFSGIGGHGGTGGDAGNPDGPWCDSEPQRHGADGNDGSDGQVGVLGHSGLTGLRKYERVPFEIWEDAFTRPYLVTTTDGQVGDSIIIETFNLSGTANLTAIDELNGSSSTHSLVQLGDGRYQWIIPETMDAGTYSITIQRSSDGRVTNSFGVELTPRIDGVVFDDPLEAHVGSTAYVIGVGLRSDAQVIYDGTRLNTGNVSVASDGRDLLPFTIPVTATDSVYYVRDDGVQLHTAYLDQVFPLSDSEAVQFQLSRNAGLTFQPTVNAFDFTNGEMFADAQSFVTQDGWLGGITGSIKDGFAETDTWRLFKETYGGGEVAGLGGRFGPLNWANYSAWYLWWTQATGTCTGLSTVALEQYFDGTVTQQGKTTADLRESTIVEFGRLISDEMLRLTVAETLFDGVSQAIGGPSMTELTSRYIAGFFENGISASTGLAPTILLIPDYDTYAGAVRETFELFSDTINIFNGISPKQAFNDFTAAWSRFGKNVSGGHALSPYRVVYDDPSDSLPSRIYFYDSNFPFDARQSFTNAAGDTETVNADEIYLDIYEENGEVKFDYSMLNEFFGSYSFSSDEGWMLGFTPINVLTTDVDLLFDPLPSYLDLGPENPGEIYDVIRKVVGGESIIDWGALGFGPVDVNPPTPPQSNSVPAAPMLTAPSARTDGTTPQIAWEAVADAADYELLVYNVASGQQVLHETAITDTTFTPASPLASNSTYQVFVRARNGSGVTGSWSAPREFEIRDFQFSAPTPNPPQIPVAPSVTGPIGAIGNTMPTITWSSVIDAAEYELLAYNVETGQEVIHAVNVAGTSFTPATSLSAARYQVFVRGVNSVGQAGGFSSPLEFEVTNGSVVPGASTLTGPSGTTADSTPAITWNMTDGAAAYELLVYNIDTGQEVIHATSIAAGSFTPNSALPAAPYQAFVRGINSSGQPGTFSAPMQFQVTGGSAIPAAPVFKALTGSAASPTLNWTPSGGVVVYEVLVYNMSTGQEVIHESNLTTTSFTPTTPLASTRHQAFVRAMNSAGMSSAFSAAFEFDALTGNPTQGVPNFTAPIGATNDVTPAITWTSGGNNVTYELLVYNMDTGQEVVHANQIAATSFVPATPLPAARYQAFIRSISGSGLQSAFSAPVEFSIEITLPKSAVTGSLASDAVFASTQLPLL